MQSLSEEFVHLTMTGVSSQSHLAESSARKLYEAHTRSGTTYGAIKVQLNPYTTMVLAPSVRRYFLWPAIP